jgi:hypothetical protein
MTVKKTTIYWRDIPSQVILQRGRERQKAQLSARFQEAIDRAAMRAGKGSSDAYLSEWRRVTENLDLAGDLGRYVAAEIERLESEYSDDRLSSLIRSHGAG